MLEKIKTREDLLALSQEELTALCSEIRSFLIENLSQTGGHLASNLGIVETMVAIHLVFDTAKDRLVFDIGHQAYVHKLLTGRMDGFSTLRKFGGMSGFPKPSESEHDAFIAGHASNSVSVGLGMARARTLKKERYSVISFIGDGALTGGLAYEGLNNAGASREPLIVILNDNGMSITPNVGAISRYLAKMRLQPKYFDFKMRYRRFMRKIPFGKKLYSLTHRVKAKMRGRILGKTLFEQMGFTYLGPIDGYNLEQLTALLRVSKSLGEPVLLHIITKKGKGFAPAEKTPQNFHGVGKFDPKDGHSYQQTKNTFSNAFGYELTQLGYENDKLCAITAAMQSGTGLGTFAKAFPKRYFDVGIAEESAVSMAAGLAKQGMTPVVAIYSTFLQRAFDMLLHDVGILGLHVVFAVDRAGLVGADGETHHGMFDTGFLREVPGMQIFCPASLEETRKMLRLAIGDCKGPVAVRYPTGPEGEYQDCCLQTAVWEGTDVSIVTYGTLINEVLSARAHLAQQGVSAEVIKLATISDLDIGAISASARKTKKLLVAEETSNHGCVADEIFAALAEQKLFLSMKKHNLGNGYVSHGTRKELLHECGLDADGICRQILEDTTVEEQKAP